MSAKVSKYLRRSGACNSTVCATAVTVYTDMTASSAHTGSVSVASNDEGDVWVLQFQLTVNFVALVLSFVAAISNGETPLTVIQLLWVNLIMDALGALGDPCSAYTLVIRLLLVAAALS